MRGRERSKYNFSPTLCLDGSWKLRTRSGPWALARSLGVLQRGTSLQGCSPTVERKGFRVRGCLPLAGPGSHGSAEGLSPRPTRPSRGSLRKWIPCTSTCASPPALTAQMTLSGSPAPAAPTTPSPGSRSSGNSSSSSSRRSATAAASAARGLSMAATTAGAAPADPGPRPGRQADPDSVKERRGPFCLSNPGHVALGPPPQPRVPPPTSGTTYPAAQPSAWTLQPIRARTSLITHHPAESGPPIG